MVTRLPRKQEMAGSIPVVGSSSVAADTEDVEVARYKRELKVVRVHPAAIILS